MTRAEAKIMLVEDDAEARNCLGEILELEGFKVIACANGAEALHHLTHASLPRLVIMICGCP